MWLFGLAGLSLILLLPLVQTFSPDSRFGFWEALGAVADACRAFKGNVLKTVDTQ
jgi:hypothetical protein